MTALVRLMAKHRGAFEYDWRARFGLPLTVVGRAMTWGEAVRLTQVLAADPASAVCAALNEWDYPLSREAIALADLFDLQHITKSKRKPPPYTRPWHPGLRRFGRTSMTPAQLRHILDTHRQGGPGHG